MLIAIYSFCAMGGVGSLWPWVVFWFGGLILYFGIFSLFPVHRTKSGLKNLFLGIVISELVFDCLWAWILYRNQPLIAVGIGICYGLFCWLAFLLVAGSLLTVKQYRNKKIT